MCGQTCEAIPDFHVSLTGGDGNTIQCSTRPLLLIDTDFWAPGTTVVVTHRGTDTTQFPTCSFVDPTDIDMIFKSLDPELFPGSAPTCKSVTSIHFLGDALAEIDRLFLIALILPFSISSRVSHMECRV
ncbi:hypothetical protein BKA82DRAFT_4149619 [Pisolithus tinctorius]|nr:hypothetical protein BKA82DRAFT_4149619 [Pisolithus tinctorius]